MTDQFGKLRRDGLGHVADILKDHEARLKKREGLSADQVSNRATQVTVIQQGVVEAKDDAQQAKLDAIDAKADALDAKADAVDAKLEALQAALDAANAQQQIELDQMADPGNLFDYAPIIAKDASLFWTAKSDGNGGYMPAGTPNIVEWFPDGFTVQATEPGLLAIGNRRAFQMGPEVRYTTRFSAAYSPTSSPWPVGVVARLGLWVGPYAWSAVDGPIGIDQPFIGSQFANPNTGVDGEWNYPNDTKAISTFPGDPARTTWRPAFTFRFANAGDRFTVRKIRMQVIAGTLDFVGGSTIPGTALPNGVITTTKVADGAITQVKLGSDVVLGVADNSLTTPKYQNLSVTDAKIDTVAATKLTGTVVLARLPATISGRTLVGGTTGQFDNLTRVDGSAWVGSVPHVEVTASSAVSNATVTNVGGFNFDTATSNDLTFITGISNGVVGFVKPGNYLITTRQNTPVYPITARSFVDIEQFISGAWVRINRTTIPTGEDFVSATASARVPSASSGSPAQVRFTVYRQVSNTSQAFQTRAIIDRLGDA